MFLDFENTALETSTIITLKSGMEKLARGSLRYNKADRQRCLVAIRLVDAGCVMALPYIP